MFVLDCKRVVVGCFSAVSLCGNLTPRVVRKFSAEFTNNSAAFFLYSQLSSELTFENIYLRGRELCARSLSSSACAVAEGGRAAAPASPVAPDCDMG